MCPCSRVTRMNSMLSCTHGWCSRVAWVQPTSARDAFPSAWMLAATPSTTAALSMYMVRTFGACAPIGSFLFLESPAPRAGASRREPPSGSCSRKVFTPQRKGLTSGSPAVAAAAAAAAAALPGAPPPAPPPPAPPAPSLLGEGGGPLLPGEDGRAHCDGVGADCCGGGGGGGAGGT